jgi:hypothetical protein
VSDRREARERRHRVVPLNDRHVARFQSELPLVIRYLEERQLPGEWRWGASAIGYGATTMAGLYWFSWSPVLVIVHLLLSQWIPLLAEVLVLRRLQARGVTRLVTANEVLAFASAVRSGLERAAAQRTQPAVPMILESVVPDSDIAAGSFDKTTPGAIASSLVFLGVIASAILGAAIWFTPEPMRDVLMSQPWAIAVLGGMSLVQLRTQYHAKLAPPLPGATWNVEFSPGLRGISVVLLGILSPVMIEAGPEDQWQTALGAAAVIAGWGVIALLSWRMRNASMATWRRYRDGDASVLLASLSRSG